MCENHGIDVFDCSFFSERMPALDKFPYLARGTQSPFTVFSEASGISV